MSTRRNPQPDPRQAFRATATALADLVRSVVVDAPRTATLEAISEDASIRHETWIPGRAGPRKPRPTHRTAHLDETDDLARLSEAVAELRQTVARLEARVASASTPTPTTGTAKTPRTKPGRRAKR